MSGGQLQPGGEVARQRDDGDVDIQHSASQAALIVKIPSPEQIVTRSNRSSTRSFSKTSRRARSAPSGPDRQRCRAPRNAKATVGAA